MKMRQTFGIVLVEKKTSREQKTTVWTGIKHSIILGWRDILEVKSIDCSSRGPEFNSQPLHCGSQPSLMRFDAFFWHAGKYADIVYIIINKANI